MFLGHAFKFTFLTIVIVIGLFPYLWYLYLYMIYGKWIKYKYKYMYHHVVILRGNTWTEIWDRAASSKPECLVTHHNLRGSLFWYSYHGAALKMSAVLKGYNSHIRGIKLAKQRLHCQVSSSSEHTECATAGNFLNLWALITLSEHIMLCVCCVLR
jgi:hypothetical protein